MFIDLKERGRKREREKKHQCERETLMGWLLLPPDQGLNTQPSGALDDAPTN